GTPVTEPKIGDIVVFWRGTRDGWQGHVAFYIREDADGIFVLGGNQSNQVCIAEYPKNQLLGYRRIESKDCLDAYDTKELVKEVLDRFHSGK
ncbi:MAG: hypothetical protein KDH96_12745, partial [Candidatus Riesia sp.]|nr:hypothetical protein [Candidatus Riesia sp.]